MHEKPNSVRRLVDPAQSVRRKLTLKDEFVLAILPTVVVLCVLALIEALSQQRVLFASLASSAFLIYLDPQHPANSMRSLMVSHLAAAFVGAGVEYALGPGYNAAAVSMVATIVLIISADAVHPPAVGTALSFAFRPSDVTVLTLFILCLIVIAILVALQRSMLKILARLNSR